MAAAAIAWSLLAFGGVYPWTAPPLLALAVAAMLLARARPRLADPIDAAFLAVLAVIALQLAPMPMSVVSALSPDAAAYRAAMVLDYDAQAWQPLTLDPRRTRIVLMLAAAAFALFAATRRIAARDGRFLARWVAWVALAGSLLGIGGKTLFPSGRIYGFWTPLESGAAPFGAVINRNHFADWALMAVIITLAGLAAHLSRRDKTAGARRTIVDVLGDGRVPWLLFAAAITVAAIVLTASRSAFAALVAASAAVLMLMRNRAGGRAVAAVSVAGLLCLAAALTWARPDRLLSRIDASGGELGLRQAIWRQSIDIARRYPVAGVGAGAFPAAMAFYQTGDRAVFFNHAHNQYVEIVTEGGALAFIPLAALVVAIAWRTRGALRTDRGRLMWLRIGAAGALTGLAIVCIWESPFRTPATLMLAAVAAGLASAFEDRG